ncbi:hypothetical protein FHX16_003687 [Rhizobium sp. BK661]|nr:hypothetical protein [Rhizobium sp. BK661]
MTDQSNRLVLHTNLRDEVFADERDAVADFSFNSTVANVFDDMVSRSVPFYDEMQRMVCELAKDFHSLSPISMTLAVRQPQHCLRWIISLTIRWILSASTMPRRC